MCTYRFLFTYKQHCTCSACVGVGCGALAWVGASSLFSALDSRLIAVVELSGLLSHLSSPPLVVVESLTSKHPPRNFFRQCLEKPFVLVVLSHTSRHLSVLHSDRPGKYCEV